MQLNIKEIVFLGFIGLVLLATTNIAQAEEQPKTPLIDFILAEKGFSAGQNMLRLGSQYALCKSAMEVAHEGTIIDEDVSRVAAFKAGSSHITLSIITYVTKFNLGHRDITKISKYCSVLNKEYKTFFRSLTTTAEISI